MPKLSKTKAKAVSKAESSFAPLDEGIYIATLKDVTDGHQGANGEYWRWEFENLRHWEDGEIGDGVSGRQWVNTSLSEKADWKMQEMFKAFGVPADTDTEEMLGEDCLLVISQRVIESGARIGQTGNNVDRCLPLTGEEDDEDEDEEDDEDE